MSDKNRDVDRAIASIGGEGWVYHSFESTIMSTGKIGSKSSLAYNEFGEPQYAAGSQLPPLSSFSSPEDEYLEDAAYPETHPDETWYDIPAPESHAAVFMAPAVAMPAVAIRASIGNSPLEQALAPVAQGQSGPPVFAARQATIVPAAFVPFLPLALPQSNVHVSAQPYPSAERATERPSEHALLQTLNKPVVLAPKMTASTSVTRSAALPFLKTPLSAPTPETISSVAPTAASRIAYTPASPPRAGQTSAGYAEGTSYPQPFETLADTYARLARRPQENAATPRPSMQDGVNKQEMFRRL